MGAGHWFARKEKKICPLVLVLGRHTNHTSSLVSYRQQGMGSGWGFLRRTGSPVTEKQKAGD